MNGNSHRIGLGHQLGRRQKRIHLNGNIMGFLPQIQKLPYKTTPFTLVEKGLNRNHFVKLDRTKQSTVQIVLIIPFPVGQESRYIVHLLQEKPDIRNPRITNDIIPPLDRVKCV